MDVVSGDGIIYDISAGTLDFEILIGSLSGWPIYNIIIR